MWHHIDDCQLCAMFDQIDSWGLPITPYSHKPVLYPDRADFESGGELTADYGINLYTVDDYDWGDDSGS